MTTSARVQLLLESTEQRDARSRSRGVLEGGASHDYTHDHDRTTTPTTKGCRSDVSIILPVRSVTLVGPWQYPRITSAVKDGRPWVASATHKAAKHHMNTQEHDPHQNFLIRFPRPFNAQRAQGQTLWQCDHWKVGDAKKAKKRGNLPIAHQ